MAGKSFKGNLEILNLSDIFQSLAMNRHSGTLVVNDGKREKKIFFAEGEISLLSSGKRMRLGDLLIAAGKITEEDLDLALKLQKQSRKKLGEILVEEGFCEEEDIDRILRLQIEEEIYDLFLWRKAEFEFLADQMPEDMARESPNLTRLNINTNSLIMEALRRLDEWSLIQDAVPTTKEVFVLDDRGAFGSADISDNIKRNPELVDGKTTVMGLAERYFMSEFELCQHLATLVKAGAIRALSQEELIERAETAYALNDFNGAAALYGRLAEYHPNQAKIMIPLADSLRRTGVEKQALGIYEALAGQLERDGQDPDRLRQCYEAILQLDSSRTDLARRIEDLDLRLASTPTKRRVVPVLLLLLLAALAGWGYLNREWLKAQLKRPSGNTGEPDTADGLLEKQKRAENAARHLIEKGQQAEAIEKLREWHQLALKIWQENPEAKGKVVLPIFVSTVPAGVDVYVNDEFQGTTSIEKPGLVCTYGAATGVNVEVYGEGEKFDKDGKPSGIPARWKYTFEDPAIFQPEVKVAIYDAPKPTVITDGWLQHELLYSPSLDALVTPERTGLLRVLRWKPERSELLDLPAWGKVELAEPGDLSSPPQLIATPSGERLFLGICEWKGESGVLALDLAKDKTPGDKAPGEPRLYYVASRGGQVVSRPVVIPPREPQLPRGRVVFGTLLGGIYAYDLIGGGRPLWEGEADGPVEQPGLALSAALPNAAAGLVVFSSRDASVRAFEPIEGRLVWTYRAPRRLVGPPLAHGQQVLVQLEGGEVHALDAASGAERGLVYEDPSDLPLTVLARDEVLYLANSQGQVVALQGTTVRWRREFQRTGDHVPRLALAGGRLLATFEGPELFALETSSGGIVWQARWSQGGRVISPISVLNDAVFVATERRDLHAFKLPAEEPPR